MSQRRFAVMNDNIFKVVTKLTKDQELCRLLYYTDNDPLAADKPDIKGLELLNKNILVVPKIPDDVKTKENYIIVLFDNFIIDPSNQDFKIVTVRFDIICPFDEWLLESASLRPYLLMQRIDDLFNQQKLAGIGNLKFNSAEQLVLSPALGGYSMEYAVDEFN